MIDTCQANTLYSKFYSPNILATGSSEKDENSYSVGPLSDFHLSDETLMSDFASTTPTTMSVWP